MFKKFLSFILAAVFTIPLFGFGVKLNNDNSGYYCDTTYMEGGGNYQMQTITIEFDSYTMNEVYLDRLCPCYENYNQLNSCVPMAGAIIVAYYDFIYEELIPNCVTGQYYNGVFYYRSQAAAVTQTKEELYTLMGTNTINPGTSVAQFRTGLTAYVTNKSRSVSYLNCGTSTVLDINTAINFFNQEIPIIAFLNSYVYYTLAGINEHDTYITMNEYSSSNGHAVVAFGYREYNYYQDGAIFRTDKFLIVSFGDNTQGLIPINNLNLVDDCLAVQIS